jgi:hypothetical protein
VVGFCQGTAQSVHVTGEGTARDGAVAGRTLTTQAFPIGARERGEGLPSVFPGFRAPVGSQEQQAGARTLAGYTEKDSA